jgi:hypothetical protein
VVKGLPQWALDITWENELARLWYWCTLSTIYKRLIYIYIYLEPRLTYNGSCTEPKDRTRCSMARRPLDADRITSPRIGPCAHTPSRNRHMPRNRTTSHGPTTSFFSGLPEFFRGGTRRRHFFHYTAHFIHCPSLTLATGWPPDPRSDHQASPTMRIGHRPLSTVRQTSRRMDNRPWNDGMAGEASSRLAHTPLPIWFSELRAPTSRFV